jgi:hypothetical protein
MSFTGNVRESPVIPVSQFPIKGEIDPRAKKPCFGKAAGFFDEVLRRQGRPARAGF